MGKIDWSKRLSKSQKGLAVEGTTDKLILEVFLETLDPKWTHKLLIVDVGSFTNVLKELSENPVHPRVYGLIDRDSRTDPEIRELEKKYNQLFVLPRVVIENYCIDPDEIELLLPKVHRNTATLDPIRHEIETHINEWKNNRAIEEVMYERGATSFCEGQEGFPRLITHHAVTKTEELQQILSEWHGKLEPASILADYNRKVDKFSKSPSSAYRLHLHGKRFFEHVVVPTLQKTFPKQPVQSDKPSASWLKALFREIQPGCKCPDDLNDILQELLS